ncbi:MAG TPA: hypothetical protein VFI99_12560 [Nocardioides sp.]|nr:hypothetical protein [Nocardioides sp.]
MDGERAEQSTLARVRDDVIGALSGRVEVESVQEQPHSIVLISVRLPEGITEQVRLATQEWVQLQLIALQSLQPHDGLVYVPHYVGLTDVDPDGT